MGASSPSGGIRSASSAISRIAVSIVPSTGWRTAQYARVAASRSAAAASAGPQLALGGRQRLGQPAHDLAEDHAAVAAGSHQCGLLRRVGDSRPVGIGQGRVGQCVGQRRHRLGQIGSGIAVGHRIDVEVVQPLAVCLERGAAALGEGPGDLRRCGHEVRFTPCTWICTEPTVIRVIFSTL